MQNVHIPEIEVNPEQVKNVLMFIDTTQSEEVRRSIFCQLGAECFYTRGLERWIEPYLGHVQAFLDRINIEQTSRYWEKLEFTPDGKTLLLTGRKVENCACAYSDSPQPPRSLCLHCCRAMQEELFGKLLGQKVAVEITEAFLLGGERCSTAIRLVEA
jgi:hypothetical protein